MRLDIANRVVLVTGGGRGIGINVEGWVDDLDLAAWRRCFDVIVAGVFLMSQALTPHVKASDHGCILNAASFAAIVPSVGVAAYSASKAAVAQFTWVLAGELGPRAS